MLCTLCTVIYGLIKDHSLLVKYLFHLFLGVPTVVQGDQYHLRSAGTQVQSPAWHNWLRIWYCGSCGLGHRCCSNLIPRPGTPCTLGWPKKEKKKISYYVIQPHFHLQWFSWSSLVAQWVKDLALSLLRHRFKSTPGPRTSPCHWHGQK